MVKLLVYIKMVQKNLKVHTKKGKKMGYGLLGMRMDRKVLKEITSMENIMDYTLLGT